MNYLYTSIVYRKFLRLAKLCPMTNGLTKGFSCILGFKDSLGPSPDVPGTKYMTFSQILNEVPKILIIFLNLGSWWLTHYGKALSLQMLIANSEL